MAKYSILVVNGPNLNLLGTREPEIYGHETIKDLENMLKKVADELNVDIECYQSNHEGDIVDKIQNSRNKVDFILLNAGAYTHTSVAIRDALAGIDSHSMRFTFPMFTNERNLDIIHFFQRWLLESL